MWFKRKLEKKTPRELTKGKGKRRCLKEKKKKRKSIEQMETGGSTPLVFPLERLNLNWKKKRSSLRLSQEKWWVGELSANGSYRGVQRKNCGDENVASETIAERNQLKDKTWTGRGKKKKKSYGGWANGSCVRTEQSRVGKAKKRERKEKQV